MRMNNAITTLVSKESEGDYKWARTLAAANGCLRMIVELGNSIQLTNPSLQLDLTSVTGDLCGLEVP